MFELMSNEENTQARILVIGVGGAMGEVRVFCQKAEYKTKGNAFLLIAQYSLLFGEEEQRTGIRLYAKGDNV